MAPSNTPPPTPLSLETRYTVDQYADLMKQLQQAYPEDETIRSFTASQILWAEAHDPNTTLIHLSRDEDGEVKPHAEGGFWAKIEQE